MTFKLKKKKSKIVVRSGWEGDGGKLN